jgi:rhamnosyl/mannosyltransferase
MEAEWKRNARILGVTERVSFVGEIEETHLPAYYAASDVVVLPSILRSEAFGTVLVEGMAAGRAVISTELGTGTSFVNIDGVTGFVVRPRDPAALASALECLITDAALRTRMGAAGKTRVQQELTLEKMTDRVLNQYQLTSMRQM